MPTSFKEDLKLYKDTLHTSTLEEDVVQFKKPTKNKKHPWILEYYYSPNNSSYEWMHGWHKKDSYQNKTRATQALEQMKKSNINMTHINNYRIYDIRKGIPTDE